MHLGVKLLLDSRVKQLHSWTPLNLALVYNDTQASLNARNATLIEIVVTAAIDGACVIGCQASR